MRALIIHGGKDVENPNPGRELPRPLAIHAGLRYSDRETSVINRLCGLELPPWNVGHTSELQGVIIGVVQLVAVHQTKDGCCESPWADRSYVERGGRTRHQLTHLVLADRGQSSRSDARAGLGCGACRMVR